MVLGVDSPAESAVPFSASSKCLRFYHIDFIIIFRKSSGLEEESDGLGCRVSFRIGVCGMKSAVFGSREKRIVCSQFDGKSDIQT